jgi:hypothetical protein
MAMLASAALLLAGCGGDSPSNKGIAHLGSNRESRSRTAGGAAGPGSDSPQAAALAFAKCMRSAGVPNFPDPTAGGGFVFRRGAGVEPASPAFQAAQKTCGKFLPSVGAPGSGPRASVQALAKMLKVSQCMRTHGVPDFPDPQTTVPSDPRAALGASGVISDIEGVILVFPGTIDQRSPTFARAADTCAFPLHDH